MTNPGTLERLRYYASNQWIHYETSHWHDSDSCLLTVRFTDGVVLLDTCSPVPRIVEVTSGLPPFATQKISEVVRNRASSPMFLPYKIMVSLPMLTVLDKTLRFIEDAVGRVHIKVECTISPSKGSTSLEFCWASRCEVEVLVASDRIATFAPCLFPLLDSLQPRKRFHRSVMI